MNITALVEQGIQPIPQPEPLRLHVEDIDEEDGILPNQQVLAQEMLSRILIMTGRCSVSCICHIRLLHECQCRQSTAAT